MRLSIVQAALVRRSTDPLRTREWPINTPHSPSCISDPCRQCHRARGKQEHRTIRLEHCGHHQAERAGPTCLQRRAMRRPLRERPRCHGSRCKSHNVSRSRHWRIGDVFMRLWGMHAYRCHECRKRFYLPAAVAQQVKRQREWRGGHPHGRRRGSSHSNSAD